MIIDLSAIYLKAFGVVDNKINSLFEEKVSGGAVEFKDGRSTYEYMTMRRTGVELKFGFAGFQNIDDSFFAPPPIISVVLDKRLEETIMTAVDNKGTEINYGQVIEVYGKKPTDVSMKGVIIDMISHQYPGDKLRKLREMFEYNGVWEVEGQIWRDLDIRSVYIVPPLPIDMVEGFEDTWSYNMTLRSIKPAEYYLKFKQGI
jgi:Domain of unknown function (DUF6046)